MEQDGTPLRRSITLDIGGTHWRVGVFEEGSLTVFLKGDWGKELPPDKGVSYIQQIVAPYIGDGAQGLGISFPGLIDREGFVHSPPNLPLWDGFNLRKALSKTLGLPVCVANDASMYALGEWLHGAAMGFTDVLIITLGTGIGGGVILQGKLLLGSHGFAAEIGHLFIDGELSMPCGCGNRGCLEAFLGASSFMTKVEESYRDKGLKGPKDLEGLRDLARAGDRLALSLWEEYGRLLGRGVQAALNLLDPEGVVVGGGVSEAWEFFSPGLLLYLTENTMGWSHRRTKILRARLGEKAALWGMFEFMKRGCYEKTNGD